MGGGGDEGGGGEEGEEVKMEREEREKGKRDEKRKGLGRGEKMSYKRKADIQQTAEINSIPDKMHRKDGLDPLAGAGLAEEIILPCHQ
jgi:hypothetical protein